jgi:hypothetical protein
MTETSRRLFLVAHMLRLFCWAFTSSIDAAVQVQVEGSFCAQERPIPCPESEENPLSAERQ